MVSSAPASPCAPCFPQLARRWGTCSSGVLRPTNPEPRMTQSTGFEGPAGTFKYQDNVAQAACAHWC